MTITGVRRLSSLEYTRADGTTAKVWAEPERAGPSSEETDAGTRVG